jgi:hypothetical protein
LLTVPLINVGLGTNDEREGIMHLAGQGTGVRKRWSSGMDWKGLFV